MTDTGTLPCFRLFSLWILVQRCGALRFSDHLEAQRRKAGSKHVDGMAEQVKDAQCRQGSHCEACHQRGLLQLERVQLRVA